MPYADPEIRKKHGRETMRRWRARQPKQFPLPAVHAVLSDREYKKQWIARNPEKAKAYQLKYRLSHPEIYKKAGRNHKLKKAYGITAAQFDALLAAQNGVCAICGKAASGKTFNTKHLHVDHDHATGEVRGLLCLRCNNGIGRLGDSVELLEKALGYLRGVRHPS